MVPEAATLLMKGGAMIVSSEFTAKEALNFQKALLLIQIALEDNFYRLAKIAVQTSNVLILIDRGLLDGAAYVSVDIWEALMEELQLGPFKMRDDRYEAVIHLVTAADGAEEFYDQLTNDARYESIEEA